MKNGGYNFKVKLFHAELKFYGCDPVLLNDTKKIEELLRKGARAARMKLLRAATQSHKFKPQGLTAYVLLSESHISIHTWPEHDQAVVDILTCNSKYVLDAIQLFKKELKPKRMRIRKLS